MIEPKTCRAFAARCIELANQAALLEREQQSALFVMADRWRRLATELETNPEARAQFQSVDDFPSRDKRATARAASLS